MGKIRVEAIENPAKKKRRKKRRVKVAGRKNPRIPFGRRKVRRPKGEKTKRRIPFGRRKVATPGRTQHIIAAYVRGQNGPKYYFDGVKLNSDKKKAALFNDWRQAEAVMAKIENRVPAQIRAVAVVAAI